MSLDIHQHLWPPAFVAALKARSRPPRLRANSLELGDGTYQIDLGAHDLDTRLASLDRHEIDTAVVSLQPTLGIDALAPSEAEELHLIWEQGAQELIGAAPKRLAALSCGRAAPGFAGAIVAASALRDVDALGALLRDLNEADAMLFVHPSAAMPTHGAPPWWPAIADYTAEMQAAYLTWLSYAQERWPAVAVVFAILAGGGPFQLERLASRGVDVRSGLHQNVFFDTASYGRRAIELCIETYGVHQLVYGSDVPVIDPSPTLRALEGFGPSVLQLVTTDNPSRLFT